MKSILALASLLSVTASAFADHTRFVASRATESIAAPTRELNAYRPYSRSDARFIFQQPSTTPRREASTAEVHPAAPYNRSHPRFGRANS